MLGEIPEFVPNIWRSMFTPPWRDASVYERRWVQVLMWLMGWCWSILGLILGAFIAPPLLNHFGLTNNPYQDWIIYAIAAASAFAVQIVSFVVWFIPVFVVAVPLTIIPWFDATDMDVTVGFIVAGVLSLTGESYALWRFIQTQNVHQGVVTSYIVGGFILKAIILPALKTFIFGVFFKWLFGRKPKPK